MKKRFLAMTIFLPSILLMAGCATTGSARTWVGHTENELAARLGPPDDVKEINARTHVLTYNTFSAVFLPSQGDPHFAGNTAFYDASDGKTPAQNKGNRCHTTFTVADGNITDWKWEGQGCEPA